MREIALFFIGDTESSLIVSEDGTVNGNDKIINNQNCKNYIIGRYNSLGNNFDEIWNRLSDQMNDKDRSKELIFWDDPLIKAKLIEV